jgi:hypothetical protein
VEAAATKVEEDLILPVDGGDGYSGPVVAANPILI